MTKDLVFTLVMSFFFLLVFFASSVLVVHMIKIIPIIQKNKRLGHD